MRVFLDFYMSAYIRSEASQLQITMAVSTTVIIIYNYFLMVCWLMYFNGTLSATVIANLSGICGIKAYPKRNNVVK